MKSFGANAAEEFLGARVGLDALPRFADAGKSAALIVEVLSKSAMPSMSKQPLHK